MTAWLTLAIRPAVGQTADAPTPDQLVQQQVDAWNRHDAGAFAALYSDTTRVYVFPEKLPKRFSTRQELRQDYAQLFARNPQVHCAVTGRLAAGNTVILGEHITGRADGREIRSIVTYKIEGGKIARVHFDYRP